MGQGNIIRMGLGLVLVAGLLAWAAPAAAEQVIYPSKGQSADQQQKDTEECSKWAVEQSGVNPTASSTTTTTLASQQTTTTGPMRGRGVTRTRSVGTATRSAGGGTATATGRRVTRGVGRAGRIAPPQAGQPPQLATTTPDQAAMDKYNRAFSACMEGKGYVVK